MMTSQPLVDASAAAARQIVDRILAVDREHRHVELAAERLQLLDGGRAIDIGGDQERLLLVRLLEPAGELAARGRLARALQAAHHDAGRALLGPLELGVDRAHHLDELVLADRDERLLRRDRLGAVLLALRAELDLFAARGLFDARDERLDDAELDVAFEQRQAHVAQRLVDDVVGELGDAGETLASGLESLGEGL